MYIPYRETAGRWVLQDIFDENQVIELAYEVREYYGFEDQDYAGEEYIYEDDAAEMMRLDSERRIRA